MEQRNGPSANEIPEIVKVEKNLNDELLKYFRGERDGYVQVGPKKWFYPMKYQEVAREYVDFEVRPSDVWITGVPRSGTTVTQELAWLLSHDLDFEGAKQPNEDRVRFYEGHMVLNEKMKQERLLTHPEDKEENLENWKKAENTLKLLNGDTKRRVIKAHLPFELLPPDLLTKGCKVIYLCRFPKDVAVSYFFLQSKSFHIDFKGDFQKYWSFFQNGNCMFGPYFEHIRQGFEKRNNKNFLFVFYEELREDLEKYIRKISEFLERPLDDKEMIRLKEYLDFDSFQKSPAVATISGTSKDVKFVRKGKVGGWREHFTDEMNKRADKWIEKNMREIGIRYPGQE